MKTLALYLTLLLTAYSCAQTIAQDPIVANPNRPTVANPADITQFGVAEIEYGFSASKDMQSLDGLLKFAVARDLEVRIGTNTFLHDGTQPAAGAGDTTLGLQWRLAHQKRFFPTVAVSYLAKVPTAQSALGSGEFDHELTVLLSKDIRGSHFDANLSYDFIGRAGAPGFDHLFVPTLAWSHAIKGRWGTTAEIWGTTHQNATIKGTTSLLAAATYQARRRLVFDAGMNCGLRGDVPRATFFVGITYSIFDLYHPSRR